MVMRKCTPKPSSHQLGISTTTPLLVHSRVLFRSLSIKQLLSLFQHCPRGKKDETAICTAHRYCNTNSLRNCCWIVILLISLSSLPTNYIVTIGSVLKSCPKDTWDLPTANTASFTYEFTQIKWFTQIQRLRLAPAGPGEELSLSPGSQKSCAGSEGVLWLRASIWGVPLLFLCYCC